MKKETLVTTLGRTPESHGGVVNTPVYRASTILFPSLEAFENSEKGVAPLIYGRSGTPATRQLEAALAELDGADRAILTCSGQAAIVTAVTAFLGSGDHLLAPDSIYGSMRRYCDQELVRFGVEVTYYDPLIGAGIAELIRPNTRVVYCESPGSLTFEVQDIPAIAKAAHAKDAIVIADNTWATPLFQRTFDLGVDVSVHSCTKYIGGHSDLLLGLITCKQPHFAALRRAYRNIGAGAGADETFLAARGLRTLAVRMQQHHIAGLELARFLAARPEVERVLHPALPGCPGHELWKRDFAGASGLFSIILKPCSKKALAAMLDGFELFGMGFSWGGYESLMIPFTPNRTASPHWKAAGPALRVHAGLEAVEDLLADLEAGFKRLGETT